MQGKNVLPAVLSLQPPDVCQLFSAPVLAVLGAFQGTKGDCLVGPSRAGNSVFPLWHFWGLTQGLAGADTALYPRAASQGEAQL